MPFLKPWVSNILPRRNPQSLSLPFRLWYWLSDCLSWKKPSSRQTIFAICLAFAGVVICVAFSPGFSLGGKGLGYLYLLGAVTSGAFYTYSSSKAAADFDAIEVTFTMAVMGAVFFNGVNLILGNGFQGFALCFTDMKVLGGVLFLGICCSCFSYLIFNFVLSKMPTAIGTNLVANSVTAVGVLIRRYFSQAIPLDGIPW